MLTELPHHPGRISVADAAEPRISAVMPLAAWNEDAQRCVERLARLLRPGDECLLVPDGFALTADLPPPCRIVPLAAHGGPGAARNAGARVATGDVLLFVDADVLLAETAVERVRLQFARSDITALFGSYDDAPSAPGAVSRFRNLLHHFQHQTHAGPARSFWTGCGAIRRDAFERIGGFSVRYDRPAMEDVELGARLVHAGGAIRLDPGLLCTHLKRWTLRSMIVTDIRDRAIPWSRLIYREGGSVAVLNADARGRVSVALATGLGACLVLSSFWSSFFIGAAAALIMLLLWQRSFLALLRRCGGWRLLALGSLLLPVHLVSGALGFGYVTAEVVLRRLREACGAGPR